MVQQNDQEIRSSPCLDCFLCGTKGKQLYQGLRDHLFNVPGQWNLKQCPDPQCGIAWLDPMPVEDDIAKAYKNYFTHQETTCINNTWRYRISRFVTEGYASLIYGYRNNSLSIFKKLLGLLVSLHPGYRADMDFSVMYLPARAGGHILDVGCGSGQMIEFMHDHDWNVEGLDFDPYAVENARRKGLEVNLGQLEAQNYPDDYFDAITMSHLIEHVYNPLRLLQECYRILKPGGHLVVVTPNIRSWGHKHFKASWLHLDPPRHLYIFTVTALRHLAEKEGFQKLRVTTSIRWANSLFMGSRSIKRTGIYILGSNQPLAVRLWALSMQLAEWVFLKLKPYIGEEIVLIGEK